MPTGAGLVSRDEVARQTGIELLQGMLEGRYPPPPMANTLGFRLIEIGPGRAVFEGEAGMGHYNPLGVVHGGWAATLLDSCLGCAVHTLLPKGVGYTTLEVKVNFVRAIATGVGPLQAIGTVIHSGRQVATAEARLVDPTGKLFAHGTTTCLIFPL
ncbi:MAG: PaaI family thioesterase [Burkholderiales bacterium]